MKRRPLVVVIVSLVLFATGAGGVVFRATRMQGHQPYRMQNASVLLFAVVAIVGGAFMLLGRSWARWLGLAWMAVDVGLSVFRSWQQALVHGVLLLLMSYALFRPEARAYFDRG